MSPSPTRYTIGLAVSWLALAITVGLGFARNLSLQGAFSLPVLLLVMTSALIGARIYAYVTHPAPTEGEA